MTLDELRERDRALAAISNGIVIADPRQPDCPLIYANDAFLGMTGYRKEEIIGCNCRFLQGAGTDPKAVRELRNAIQQERACRVLLLNYRKDGTGFWNEVTVSPVRDADGTLTHYVGVQTDVTDRQETDLRRKRTEVELRQFQFLVENASDALFLLDETGRFLYLNTAARHSLGYTAEQMQKLHVFDIDPFYNNEAYQTLFQGLSSEKLAPLESLHRRADGTTFPIEASISRLDIGGQHLVLFSARNISERKAAEEEMRRRTERERFLAELAERARGMANPDEVIADAVHSVGKFLGVSRCIFADIDIEADTCTVSSSEYRADESVASIAGVVPISAFGAFVVAEYAARRAVAVDDVRLDVFRAPEGSLVAYEAIGIRAHVTVPVVHFERVVSCISVHNAEPRHWEPEEIALLQTVVERTWLTVEVTRQQHALVYEAEARRDEAERTGRILDSVTDAFFTLDHDFRFTFVNRQAETMWNMHRAELVGRNAWEVFPDSIGSVFYHQYYRVMAEGIPESVEEYYPLLDAWLEVRAFPAADGLSVFFQNVTERKKAEMERERLLAEQHMRAEREALLNRIGLTVRNAQDPEAVQEAAVELLGEALNADRCYFAVYDLGRGIVTVARDWHRANLMSVRGVYPFENTAEMFRELYGGSNTSVVQDAHTALLSAQTRANMERLGLRSRLSVALLESEGLMATLTVAMTDAPREWTQNEVTLVEAIGTQLRTAVEAVRVAQREHNIAVKLQEALQPHLPERVQDLSVGKFTRPALDEAQVGGDFFDIFPLDKELYAIIIGDVSGKGLAAAQQLALIRNSLRTTLYLYRAPAQAVAAISAIVTSHDLLVGFVTAWVGIYDAALGQIIYASCGHEPGMVKRAATGAVELLLTTGPPLGIAENATYDEEQVALEVGDALLLYTDGISEAGRSRQELLGTTGLMRLFEALPEDRGVQAQAEMLAAQVSDFAGGVFRDDVAVLLARRE